MFSLLAHSLLSLALLSPLASATKFKEMSLEEKVASSNIIAVAKILELSCRDEKGMALTPGAKCTGPSLPNKLAYKIAIEDVLYYKSQNESTAEKPKEIDFAFTAMSHWEVPQDGYADRIGKRQIVFLRELSTGEFAPIHEAYFKDDLSQKKTVKRAIRAYQKR